MKKNAFLLVIAIMLQSCMSQLATVRLSQQDDVFSRPSLKDILSSKSSPSILVRIPDGATTGDVDKVVPAGSMYSAIENEFVRNGYVVRDRSLFNRVMGGEQMSDYETLYSITNVDFLIEVINFSVVKLSTNTYYDKKNQAKTMNESYSWNGLKVEFRVIALKENEIAGIYTFYWYPCEDGCEYLYNPDNPQKGLQRPASNNKLSPLPVESISVDVYATFMTDATRRLISEFKKL